MPVEIGPVRYCYVVSVHENRSGGEMIVFDVLNGKALRIPNVSGYHYLDKLIYVISHKGECFNRGEVCVAQATKGTIADLVRKPKIDEPTEAYKSLMKFLGVEAKQAFKQKVSKTLKKITNIPKRPRYLR